jgi:hypothetical protein
MRGGPVRQQRLYWDAVAALAFPPTWAGSRWRWRSGPPLTGEVMVWTIRCSFAPRGFVKLLCHMLMLS